MRWIVAAMAVACVPGFESSLPDQASLGSLGPTDACIFAVEADNHFSAEVTIQEWCTVVAQAGVPPAATDFPGTCMPVYASCLEDRLASSRLPFDPAACDQVPMRYACPETVARYGQCLDTLTTVMASFASFGCRQRPTTAGFAQAQQCLEVIARCTPELVDAPRASVP